MTHYTTYSSRKFYAADDIDEPFEATVERILPERLARGEEKLVAYLEGHKLGIVLSANVNLKMLHMLTKSTDYEDWAGTRVRVETELTTFAGQPKLGIRIKPPHRKRLTAAEETAEIAEELGGDAIPMNWGDEEPDAADEPVNEKKAGKKKAA